MGAFLSSMGFTSGKFLLQAINIAILVAIILIVAKGLRSFVQSARRSQDMVERQGDVLAKLEEIEERLQRLEERLEK
ncbi:MAG: hypothetical protein ACOY4Q_14825 [Bacillota bacterium]